jgi:hypothetical protein
MKQRKEVTHPILHFASEALPELTDDHSVIARSRGAKRNKHVNKQLTSLHLRCELTNDSHCSSSLYF